MGFILNAIASILLEVSV